jgi:hypothetical protein
MQRSNGVGEENADHQPEGPQWQESAACTVRGTGWPSPDAEPTIGAATCPTATPAGTYIGRNARCSQMLRRFAGFRRWSLVLGVIGLSGAVLVDEAARCLGPGKTAGLAESTPPRRRSDTAVRRGLIRRRLSTGRRCTSTSPSRNAARGQDGRQLHRCLAASYRATRRTDRASVPCLRDIGGLRVMRRSYGELVALFENRYGRARLEVDEPELVLEPLVAGGAGIP